MILNMTGKGGGGTILVSDTQDAAGGTIRTITAKKVVSLQTKTITPTSSVQTVNPDSGYDGFSQVTVNASSGGAAEGSVVVTDEPNATGTTAVVTADDVTTLITKSITQNGTYAASSDSADGYSSVTVNVSGGGSATQHTIHLEFSDSTDTDVDVYYDDSLIGTIITAYEPSTWTYSSKTVTLAQLDSVTWYDKQSIPLNTELIDFTKVSSNTAINSSGVAESAQWYYASDYTPVESGMTFSYTGTMWYYIGIYDASKQFLRSIYIYNDATVDPNDSNIGHGTLSGSELTGASYVRITSTGNYSERMSLIRTA